MSADPFQPMSMPLVISAIVAVVLLATHAGIALTIVRGVAGDDGDARSAGKRFFLRATLVCLALELALVPAVAWMLAPAGLTTRTLTSLGLGQLCLLASIVWIWRELAAPTRGSGTRFRHTAGAFLLFCLSLVVTKLVHQDETRYAYLVANPPKPAPISAVVPPTPVVTPPVAATPPTATPTTVISDDPLFAKGEKVFKTVCIVCHAVDKRLVGPPIQEIAEIYKGNPAGIAAWAKAPGKKRPDYPPMIAVPLPEEDLKAAGVYMLTVGAKK
jgi:cytochrome c